MKFLDLVKIHIRAGSGGNGAISFRREKFIERGGPDGGNGGNGGSVLVEASKDLNTLIDFRYQQHYFAPNGAQGQGRKKTGASGADMVLKVPIGTQIMDEDNLETLLDVTNIGEQALLLKGGNGGWGNYVFRTSTNQAPRNSNPGQIGIEKTIWLRLKLIADAGLLGLPNAGKSTFLSVNSNARPKVADYPFTTLIPKLGMVRIDNSEIVLADIPGLIKDAHLGKGLGTQFLGHLERCKVLVHLIDCTSDTLKLDYETVTEELKLYGCDLINKPRLIVLNKIDALDQKTLKKRLNELKFVKSKVYLLSAIKKEGLREILGAMKELINTHDISNNQEQKEVDQWQPQL